MVALSDWLPPAFVGGLFTRFGLLKVYGLATGVQGGGCKPRGRWLCGACTSWSRGLNIGVTVLFLAIGLAHLAWLAWVLRAASTR